MSMLSRSVAGWHDRMQTQICQCCVGVLRGGTIEYRHNYVNVA